MRRMTRAALALMMTLAAAEQARAGPGHAATLAAPAGKGRVLVHGLLWRCADRQCRAMPGRSRPVVVCMAMARALGPVLAFSSGGTALDARALKRCNAPRGGDDAVSPR